MLNTPLRVTEIVGEQQDPLVRRLVDAGHVLHRPRGGQREVRQVVLMVCGAPLESSTMTVAPRPEVLAMV